MLDLRGFTMSDIICKRCGLCCHIIIDGRLSNKHCRFLIKLPNGRTVCRIYMAENRIGHDIGNGNFCHNRRKVGVNYKGCPYNKVEWGVEVCVGDKVERKC